MFLKIVLIVVGVVVALAVALFIFAQYLSLQAKRRRKAWLATHSAPVVTEERRRALVFGAIMAAYRSEDVYDLVFEGEREVYVEGLRDQWGISSRAEAIQTIGETVVMTRSFGFDAGLREHAGSAEIESLYAQVAEALELDLATVKAVQSTYAWDTCRAIALAKWCYWLEYITEDEMWGYIEQAAAKATQLGKDWQEYTISFLLGRLIHGFGLDIKHDCVALLQGRGEHYTRYSIH